MLASTEIDLRWRHADAFDQLPRGVVVFQEADVETLDVPAVFHEQVFTGFHPDLRVAIAGRLVGGRCFVINP